jgi:fructokinase
MSQQKIDVACIGEILWDLLPSGAKPGGAPMNVAYHLKKLGMQPAMISRIGKDEWGKKMLGILNDNGLTTDYIQLDQDHPTGIVNATVGENNEVSYEIVHPVAWDFIEAEERVFGIVKNAEYFIYGSLAARDEVSKKTIFALIESASCKVLDINFRPPHFSQAVAKHLLNTADILKLNEHELPLIAGWCSKFQDMDDQVRCIQDHFSIPEIIVTCGSMGAMICHQGKIVKHGGYKVKVADTVGSGDAFLAGYISQRKKAADAQTRLEFANAMGAFIASKNGACPQYEVREVYELMREPELSE